MSQSVFSSLPSLLCSLASLSISPACSGEEGEKTRASSAKQGNGGVCVPHPSLRMAKPRPTRPTRPHTRAARTRASRTRAARTRAARTRAARTRAHTHTHTHTSQRKSSGRGLSKRCYTSCEEQTDAVGLMALASCSLCHLCPRVSLCPRLRHKCHMPHLGMWGSHMPTCPTWGSHTHGAAPYGAAAAWSSTRTALGAQGFLSA